jgi:hypothetical protein
MNQSMPRTVALGCVAEVDDRRRKQQRDHLQGKDEQR